MTETFCGALGVPNGVAVTEVEATPGPAEINAVTRKAYAVPLVRPFTVKLVRFVAVLAVATVHVVPALMELSTL